jgi:hypothetical protein
MITRTAALSWVLGGALFATTAAVKSRAGSAAPAIEFAVDLPLVLSDGMPCIEVRIGDGPPVLFAIDTGDVTSVIDAPVAKGAALAVTPYPGHAEYSVAQVPDLHVGTLEFKGPKFLVQDFSKGGMIPKTAGSLAYSFFKDRILQVDFHAKKVRISAPLTGHVALPEPNDHFSLITFSKVGPPIVVASGFSVNGKPVTAQVDTLYAGSLLVYSASIDKLGLGSEAKTELKEFFPYTDGGVNMKVSAAAMEKFHGLSLGRRLYFPTPGVHEPDGLFDATVGMGVLGDTILTLNFHEGTISVQRLAAMDPDTGGATSSSGVDRERPASFNPTLARVEGATDFMLGTVLPFLAANFVGRS